MARPTFKRLPAHIGIIPDGNRRWAESSGKTKDEGYLHGLLPGLSLYETALELGVKELTFYGFTVDNTKRPPKQRESFQKACVAGVELLLERDADLLVVGNADSAMFPEALKKYTTRTRLGKGRIRTNLLVNYGWQWDLSHARTSPAPDSTNDFAALIASADVSRVDLVIRWGGRRRLSGFLPVQCVYADFYVVEALWPDYDDQHLYDALKWYENQDVTLGG